MNRLISGAMLATMLVLLAGCSTPYQQYSYFGGGGYSDVQLGENVFKVTVEANGYTSGPKATNLALLRSADLTLQHGFRYFVIVATANDTYSSSYTAPTTTQMNITRTGPYTASGTAETYGGQTYNFTFPTPSMTITCFKEKPPFQATVYDAEFASKSLRAELGIKQ
ncbi:MAG: hypothetical protein V4527_13485 [Pseudomonadota bacterium]